MIILLVVALFASDGVELRNRVQVANTQRHFSYLLFRSVDWVSSLSPSHFRFLIDRDGEEAAREAIPKYISMLSHLRSDNTNTRPHTTFPPFREMADIMRHQTLKL